MLTETTKRKRAFVAIRTCGDEAGCASKSGKSIGSNDRMRAHRHMGACIDENRVMARVLAAAQISSLRIVSLKCLACHADMEHVKATREDEAAETAAYHECCDMNCDTMQEGGRPRHEQGPTVSIGQSS